MISSIFSRGSGANRVTGSSSLGMSLMAVVLGAVGASLLQQLDLHKTTTGTRCQQCLEQSQNCLVSVAHHHHLHSRHQGKTPSPELSAPPCHHPPPTTSDTVVTIMMTLFLEQVNQIWEIITLHQLLLLSCGADFILYSVACLVVRVPQPPVIQGRSRRTGRNIRTE